jgi:hypothetical protein
MQKGSSYWWWFPVATWLLVAASLVAMYGISQPAGAAEGSFRDPSLVISTDTLAAGPSAFLLAELTDYRRYIEVERREYQSFLTRVYATIGVLIAALAGGLTFLGIKTLSEVKRQSEEKIEQAQAEVLRQTEATLQAKLGELVDQKLSEKERLVTALEQLASRQAAWIGARLRIVAEGETLAKMKALEISYFRAAHAEVGEPGPWQPGESVNGYQAIIYAYQPGEGAGSDACLVKELLPSLQGLSMPLIVYNFYHPDPFVATSDKAALDQYPFGVLANSPFTLIANTYDAVTLNLSQLSA